MKAFQNVHPTALLLYFLSVLTVGMFVTNPVLSLCALLGGILFSATLCRRGEVASDIWFYLAMFFLVAITNPLFSHNGVTPLFFLNGNPVTLEAFIYGAEMAVAIVGTLLWCKSFSRIMTSDKLLYLFGRVLPKLSLVLSMALRFIPMFLRRMRQVRAVQKTTGMYSGRGIVDKFRYSGRVFLSMIGWSLESSIETAASMKARGYGTGRRTNFSLFRFTPRDGVLLAVSLSLISIVIAGISLGVTEFYFYPRISTVSLSAPALAVYIAFGALSLLPFFVEVREVLLWKYYRSKI